jgi:hypothetical protein
MAADAGANGFSYQEKNDGNVDITVTDEKGNKTTTNVNLDDEKKKREDEKKKKEAEAAAAAAAAAQSSDEDDTETSSEDNETDDSRGVDPDSGTNMFQKYVQNKMLQKLLKNDDDLNNGQPIIVIETGDYGKGK